MGVESAMACRRLISLASAIGLLLVLCACAGSRTSTATTIALSGSQPAEPPAVGIAFPRMASLTSEERLAVKPNVYGSDYLESMPHSRIEQESYFANLNPVDIGSANMLEDAAYAMYQLRCFHEAETASVELDWLGDSPATGDCWVGLTDWEGLRWEWFALPETCVIDVDPKRFSTEEHYGYVVIVLTGNMPATLVEVRASCDPGGTAQYTLYSPMEDQHTYLINRDGQIVKEWNDDLYAAFSTYLLDNMEILRTTMTGTSPVNVNGTGGGIELWDYEGNVKWSVDLGSMGIAPHHDIEPMPNGNILVIAWDQWTRAEAIAAGRNPATVNYRGLLVDSILEIKPTEPQGATVVWEWHLKDHLIQDFDPAIANYGVVADSPELLDLNYPKSTTPDFVHANAVDYNVELDQLLISMRSPCEFFVIDHSTTSAEAASHSGGRYGKGGDILFRFGNPQNWRGGTAENQTCFYQHDSEWILDGYPGAGNILFFNNGDATPGNKYSRVLEITPPVNPDGSYQYVGSVTEAETIVWQYAHDPPEDMYSVVVSGSQRLPNGNTQMCVGMSGWFLEVDPAGTPVWQYVNKLPNPYMAGVFRCETYYLFTPWVEL